MTQPAVSELGYDRGAGRAFGVNVPAGHYTVAEPEYALQLTWPWSIQIYEQMRNEAKIAEIMRAIANPIMGARRWIDPNGARPEVVDLVSRDLSVPILGTKVEQRARLSGKFNLSEHLRMALLSLVYGHMPFEQLYAPDENLMLHLRKLGPRFPRTLAEIVTGRDGGLIGVRQHVDLAGPISSGYEPLIGVERLVMYSFEREGAAWQGRSLLRPAYRPWREKDELKKIMLTSARRNGMGVPVYTGAPGESQAQLAAGQKIASAYRGGETAGTGIPNGADISLKGVEGSLPDILAQIRYLDEEMSGLVLAQVLDLGTTASGSRALGDTLLNNFIQSLKSIQTWFVDTFNEHVIEDLVDVNWGPDEQSPLLVIEDPGADHRLTATSLKELMDSGAIQADSTLDEFVRSTFRLPERITPWVAPAAPVTMAPVSPSPGGAP